MAKYLFQVNYVGEGMQGLIKDGGIKRRAAVDTLFKSAGGSIDSFYYAFGETDLFIIGDFPNSAAAAAAVMTITSSKMVTVKTTVLILPEELDAAGQIKPIYTPPGLQIPLQNG